MQARMDADDTTEVDLRVQSASRRLALQKLVIYHVKSEALLAIPNIENLV